MRTSKAIKAGQLNPPTILKAGDNSWKVEGRTKSFYWVTRSKNGKTFYCTCPAGSPPKWMRRRPTLCRHVTAVVKDLAEREGYDVVQVWTNEADARRQRRAMVRMGAHGTPFWVTLACRWAEPPPGTRFAGIRRDRWDLEPYTDRKNEGTLFDVYYRRDGLLARTPVRRT